MKISNAVQKQIEQWIVEDAIYARCTKLAKEAKADIETSIKALADSEAELEKCFRAHVSLAKKSRRLLKKRAATILHQSFIAGKRRSYLHHHFTDNYVEQYNREQLRKQPQAVE